MRALVPGPEDDRVSRGAVGEDMYRDHLPRVVRRERDQEVLAIACDNGRDGVRDRQGRDAEKVSRGREARVTENRARTGACKEHCLAVRGGVIPADSWGGHDAAPFDDSVAREANDLRALAGFPESEKSGAGRDDLRIARSGEHRRERPFGRDGELAPRRRGDEKQEDDEREAAGHDHEEAKRFESILE